MNKLSEKEALHLLKINKFEELSRKGSHVKYGKGIYRFILTSGGYKETGYLHSKQQKELLELLKGNESSKAIERHGNTEK